MSEGDGPSRGVKRSIADVGATKQEAPPAGALGAGGGRQQESIYNSLLLLLLRESGAAVELHRLVTAGPAGRVGAAPAERAYERAIEAQRTWVCALAPWAERSAAFDGATCDRLVDFTKRLVAVSEALDRVADGDACPHHSKPSGDAAARLWSDHADADAKHSAALARAEATLTALDAIGARLGGVAAELEREGRRRGAAAPFHDETGILPLCAAAVRARLDATRACARLCAMDLCPLPEAPEPAAAAAVTPPSPKAKPPPL